MNLTPALMIGALILFRCAETAIDSPAPFTGLASKLALIIAATTLLLVASPLRWKPAKLVRRLRRPN